MSSLVANWSERDAARDLSRGLRGERVVPAAAVLREERYVKFSASRFWAGGVAMPPPPARDAEIPVHPGGFSDWDTLLTWCLNTSEASTVFVMDWQGFLIETAGSWSYEEVEAAGTQLMVTLEQADRMEPGGRAAHHIEVGFEAFTIVGLRVPPSSKESITLGVVTGAPLAPSIIKGLRDQTTASLKRL